MPASILHGDCLALLPTLPDNSIDAIVTDAPYGIKFMAKDWDDAIAFRPDVWRECLRVLKHGGYMVAFGGCRTYHRMVCAIEDAGFVIHPMLAWAFGSGFPKATNASKMIDKHLGAEREVVAERPNRSTFDLEQQGGGGFQRGTIQQSLAATPEAAQWEGWSYGLQSLKPALEPICMAQKPMIGTGAQNILAWGVGALNIDASRVPIPDGDDGSWRPNCYEKNYDDVSMFGLNKIGKKNDAGRWPPNLLHDGSEEVVECFPHTKSGDLKPYVRANVDGYSGHMPPASYTNQKGDEGSAARFFPALGYSDDERRILYCPKASKRDRAGSKHPTVKPIRLLEWLCRLITPPGGTILDPFAGSGTTGQAAMNLGFDCILVEQDAEYVTDIHRRLLSSSDNEIILPVSMQ